MGKAVKKIGNVLGLGGSGAGSGAGDPNMAFFDIEKEVKPFQTLQDELLQQQLAQTRSVTPQQGDVLEAMGQAALGKGPSLAEAQLKAAQDRTLAQQLAAAQASRGGSSAALARGLMQAQGRAGAELAQQAAQERLAERERFMNAAQTQQQQVRQDLAGGLDLALMPKREKQQPELARAQADLARTQGRKDRQTQLLGGLLSGASTVMASDEKMKKNVKSADKELAKFLDALDAKSFKYKDDTKPGTASGQRYGVMAQALEKSKVGKSFVQDTPDGKMVDVAQGFGAVLASQAELNKRLKKLEGKG